MWEIAVHVAVAGGVYDGVLLPTRFLVWDLGLTLVSEGFLSYSYEVYDFNIL